LIEALLDERSLSLTMRRCEGNYATRTRHQLRRQESGSIANLYFYRVGGDSRATWMQYAQADGAGVATSKALRAVARKSSKRDSIPARRFRNSAGG